MHFNHILITGGAGFVGSNLAVLLKRCFANLHVTALDNLKRRGSELNVPRLKQHGAKFVHGDVRCTDDLHNLPRFDLLIDCAAEPSVQAGLSSSPRYVLDTNLVGTLNCLEAARQHHAAFLLLSTSRVYPIARLNDLDFGEEETRYRWSAASGVPGFSAHGVAEEFPLDGPRSFYGASKLAAELLVQEYAHNCQMNALINRCGILTGPWQMGKVDQGVVTLWVARHYYQKPLRYIGFGGRGKQVRDMLHIEDLFDLLVQQMQTPCIWNGDIYNVGGGREISTSLLELTQLCNSVTGHHVSIGSEADTSDVDLRIYLTDSRKAQETFAWKPARGCEEIVRDIHAWIQKEHEVLEAVLS